MKNYILKTSLYISFVTALVFISGCKEVIDPTPSSCNTYNGGELYQKGIKRANVDNQASFDQGVAAAKAYYTFENGLKDGKAKSYKENYDKTYAAFYKEFYQKGFDSNKGYNDPTAITKGLADGKAQGTAKGISDGNADGSNRALSDAKKSAEANAKKVGIENGYKDGGFAGAAAGKAEGEKQGGIDGYDDGYDNGYKDGYYDSGLDCRKSTTTDPSGRVDSAAAKPDYSELIKQCEGVGYNQTINIKGKYNEGYVSNQIPQAYNDAFAQGYADADTINTAIANGKADGIKKGTEVGEADGFKKKYLEIYQPEYNIYYAKFFKPSSDAKYVETYAGHYTTQFNAYYKSYYNAEYAASYKSFYDKNYKYYYTELYNYYYKNGYKDGYKVGYADYANKVCNKSGRVSSEGKGSVAPSVDNLLAQAEVFAKSYASSLKVETKEKRNDESLRIITVSNKTPDFGVNLGEKRRRQPLIANNNKAWYPLNSVLAKTTLKDGSDREQESARIVNVRRDAGSNFYKEISRIKLQKSADADRLSGAVPVAPGSQAPENHNKLTTSQKTEAARNIMNSVYKLPWEK